MSDKPFGWVTPESIGRLARGGNCKGTVPVHQHKSRVATLAVYASPQIFGSKDICQFSEEINALEYQLTTSVKALAKTAIARAGLAAELEAANQRIAQLEIKAQLLDDIRDGSQAGYTWVGPVFYEALCKIIDDRLEENGDG